MVRTRLSIGTATDSTSLFWSSTRSPVEGLARKGVLHFLVGATVVTAAFRIGRQLGKGAHPHHAVIDTLPPILELAPAVQRREILDDLPRCCSGSSSLESATSRPSGKIDAGRAAASARSAGAGAARLQSGLSGYGFHRICGILRPSCRRRWRLLPARRSAARLDQAAAGQFAPGPRRP